MKQYLLKEYGAWSVMIISYLTGLFLSRGITMDSLYALISFSLFVNSKKAFTKWGQKSHFKSHLIVFILQVLVASLILIAIFGMDTFKLLPYIIIPVIYLLLLVIKGEHFFFTEICGFVLLTLSALIAGFSVTGYIDNKLYLSVAVFFIAGVFKVRMQIKKGVSERISMILYLIFAMGVFYLIKAPLIALLPLIDNLILSITPYNVRLKITGWIEVLKGIMFLLLITRTQGIYGP